MFVQLSGVQTKPYANTVSTLADMQQNLAPEATALEVSKNANIFQCNQFQLHLNK
jgi:hypothetical protein